MMQQINFYLPEFQPNRELFRSSVILIFIFSFILLLAIITITSNTDNKAIQKQIDQKKIVADNIKNQLQQFSDSKVHVSMIELDNKIIEIKNEISRREQLLQVISYQQLGNDLGFSAQMEAMARQSNPQISLTIFSIKRGGKYLELVGKTTSADRLPAYIAALKSETVFSQTGFGVLTIKPDLRLKEHLQFVVAESEQKNTEASISAVQLYVKENAIKGNQLP